MLTRQYSSKEKTLNHLYEISKAFDISGLVNFTSDSYEKYSKYPIFLNHYDMHFKNMIYSKGDIRIIDWATAQFSPFYSDTIFTSDIFKEEKVYEKK